MAEDPELKNVTNDLAEANNRFALDLYMVSTFTIIRKIN